MRSLLAWFLLGIMALQWVGGYPCFKGAVSVVVERSMNASEALVAEALEAETGLEVHLRMLEEESFLSRGFGYSAYFYFPIEFDDQKKFFSFTPPSEINKLVQLDSTESEAGQEAPVQVSERQFPYFIPAKAQFELPIQAKLSERSNFAFLDEPGLLSIFLETPPPERV